MALILRQEKGSKLTIQEMDDNLTYLESNGFVDGNYSRDVVGTGAVIDLEPITYDLFTDGEEGIYTVNPINGSGTGLVLTLNVVPTEGGYLFNFDESSIDDGGSDYELNDEITISTNDLGGTLDKPVILTLNSGSISISEQSTIQVLTGSITLSSNAIIFQNLPGEDPVNAGQLWNDGGTLKISRG